MVGASRLRSIDIFFTGTSPVHVFVQSFETFLRSLITHRWNKRTIRAIEIVKRSDNRVRTDVRNAPRH